MSETSAPACPDIIVDGTQLILRLDTNHSSIQRLDPDINVQTDPVIGSSQDLDKHYVDEILPSGVQLNACNQDVLNEIQTAESFQIPGVSQCAPEIQTARVFQIPEVSQCNVPVIDFSIGEQILTVTQQVPITSKTGSSKQNSIVKCIKVIWNYLTSQLGLLLLLTIYTFIGAAIFTVLEVSEKQTNVGNQPYQANARNHTNLFLNYLLQQESMINNSTNTFNLTDFIQVYEQHVKALESDFCKNSKHSHDYWRWVLFCITAYTTIGYGHIVPSTQFGKIACIIYSVIGIPLFLMTMGKLGKLFTKGLKIVWSYFRRLYYINYCRNIRHKRKLTAILTRQNRDIANQRNGIQNDKRNNEQKCEINSTELNVHNETNAEGKCTPELQDAQSQNSYKSYVVDDNYDLPPWLSIIVWAIYILFGATMYSLWETNWGYLDAVYFVFVSISTIGFGDIVPTQNLFFLVTSLYILFGLALVAMIINVLIEFFSKTFEQVHKTVTHIHVPAVLKRPITAVHLQQSGRQKHFAMNILPPMVTKKEMRVRFSDQRRGSV